VTVPLRLEIRAEVQPARCPILQEPLLGNSASPETTELAFRIFAAFRAHPHINNVLTHISRAKWAELEKSLNRILDLATTSDGLSSLEKNIIELMVGERGITGKVLKPYFLATLHRILEPSHAQRLIRHVDALYLELEWKAQHPPATAKSPARRSQTMLEANPTERVVNVADIDPRYRHDILFGFVRTSRSGRLTADRRGSRTVATATAARIAPWLALRLVIFGARPRRLARSSAPSARRRW
jgi:hypothetical protein